MTDCPRCNKELNGQLPYCSNCGALIPPAASRSEKPGLFPSLVAGNRSWKYFTTGWEIFKKEKWNFIGYALLANILAFPGNTVLSLLSSITSAVLKLSGPKNMEQLLHHTSAATFYLIAVLFVAYILCTFIDVALFSGSHIAALKIIRNQTVMMSDFFCGFRFFFSLGFATLLALLISLLPSVPAIAAFLFFKFFSFSPLDLVLKIPLTAIAIYFFIYLSVTFVFAPLFVLDKKHGFLSSLKTSNSIIKKHWWTVFGIVFMPVAAGVFVLLLLVLLAAGSSYLTHIFSPSGAFFPLFLPELLFGVAAAVFSFVFYLILVPYELCCLTVAYGDLSGLAPQIEGRVT